MIVNEYAGSIYILFTPWGFPQTQGIIPYLVDLKGLATLGPEGCARLNHLWVPKG
jgi:hypothetical protein